MLATLFMLLALPSASEPIALHPDNLHYFLFRGKPTVLITSTEHYGAVLNGDFDAIPYLDELHARGLNLTRTFSGTYREVPGSFQIEKNTLAPTPARYLAPWPRTDVLGAADGGNRFDLSRWNDAYFDRLKTFVAGASDRGIVVEYVLFCPFYEENLWAINPMNARNNVNGVGDIGRNEAFTGKHRDIQEKQEAFVRKAVRELNAFDNLYFEICNEPYFGGVTPEWQARIASVIVNTEKALPRKHLVAQNIANEKAKIDRPDPAVSIFNFHYATPPTTVGMNYGLRKVIGDDETGFRGIEDKPYRIEAWDFLMAGGAIFDHLDYSFTTDHEDGTARIVAPTPGGGGPGFRSRLQILKRFIEGFEFVKMAPDAEVIGRVVPEKASARALSEPGRAYAIYIHDGTKVELTLNLPAGDYKAEWLNPRTGTIEKAREIQTRGGRVEVASPVFEEDIVLRIRRPGPLEVAVSRATAERSLPTTMKVIPLSEAKANPSLSGRLCHEEPVIITVNGTPSFQLVPLEKDDDLIDRLLEHNPKFRRTLEARLKETPASVKDARRLLK